MKSYGIFKPFILKKVQQDGFSCSKCHWTTGCAGCVIEPTDSVLADLGERFVFAVEWHSESLPDHYCHLISEVI